MPVCISCGNALDSLTRSYGKGNVQLEKCKLCNNFADKYVENEFIIIFLDMLLQKPAVYRHLLLNQSLPRDKLQSFSQRLYILLILFEVYARWSLRFDSFLLQYFYLFSLCFIEFSVYHLSLRLIIYYIYKTKSLDDISCALVISSFGKLLLLCLSIWDYNDLKHTWLLSLVIFMTNSVALSVMLNSWRITSILILMVGIGVKVMVQFVFKWWDPRLEIVIG